MKPRLALAFLLASMIAVPAAASIPWIRDDIDAAFQQARVKKRPLLVYFHTQWCSWCVELEDKVFADEEVIYKANAFVPLRLNCDRREGQRLSRRYRVSSFPTILALSSQGDVLGRLAMFRPVPEFLRFLDESLVPGETLSAIDKRIEEGERTHLLLLRSAERHYEAGELEAAARRYGEALDALKNGPAEAAAAAHLGLGRVRAMQGDTADGLAQYRKVLDLSDSSPQVAEAFVGALYLLREENRGEEIDALFIDFADRFPDDPAILHDHARRLLETGREIELAFEKVTRACELSPDFSEYHGTRARALLALGRPSEAFEAVNLAIDLRPTSKDLRVLRLEILEALQDEVSPTPPAGAEEGDREASP